jgi:phosphate acyltransferase
MRPIRLAIDVVSGDNGTRVILNGILEARRHCSEPFDAYLCGDERKISAVLADMGGMENRGCGRIIIEHCGGTVDPHDVPTRVWKTSTDSPIIRVVTLQKEGKVDASVSAGDTGILMSAALFILGRQAGALRPALAAFLPTAGGGQVLLLDVGANLNCRVDHLVCFGLMGYSYVKKFWGRPVPKLKLLNVGTEPTKGTRVLFDTGQRLQRLCRGYAGFIEGSGVLRGEADVVVCDGFVGNVLLKACESFYSLARGVLGEKTGMLAKFEHAMDGVLNPENYGAVPFLGIRGAVLKAHGSSTSRSIANAILAAITAVRKRALAADAAAIGKGIR